MSRGGGYRPVPVNLSDIVEIVVLGMIPAIGGLLTLVRHHGRDIAAMQAQIKTQGEAVIRIEADLRALNEGLHGLAVGVERAVGELKALRERTDMLLRQVDRHESFLYRTDSKARAR